jgi:TonB family protein
VPYPATGRGDAVVLLELLIDARGDVAEARVVTGDEPFSGQALTAARRWRFSPALQGATARAARIRFEASFSEPVPEPEDEPAPVPAGPATAAPQEVTVHGRRQPVGSRHFTRAEVRQLPGAFGDPFRAIEALPGVTPIASGVPFFYVRGAPPGNVGYFLDGIRVPLLYHVGLGPSVVHPGMVSSVELYPGAYPAEYGRFGGGIVAGLTTEPSEELAGEWQVRLFDSGAMIEAPFADGRGHLLLGGRYSYTAAVISLFADDVRLEYWDYQLRASYRVSESDTLGIFGFGSFDYFGEDTGSDEDEFLGTEFHRVDLRHEHRFEGEARWRSAVTLGYDRSRGEDESALVSPSLAARP